jgi:hypothetical protein
MSTDVDTSLSRVAELIALEKDFWERGISTSCNEDHSGLPAATDKAASAVSSWGEWTSF